MVNIEGKHHLSKGNVMKSKGNIVFYILTVLVIVSTVAMFSLVTTGASAGVAALGIAGYVVLLITYGFFSAVRVFVYAKVNGKKLI